MVLDILKSEEGQKAVRDALNKSNEKSGRQGGQGIQILSTPQGEEIQMMVKNILTDPDQSSKLLQKMMTDPKFAGDFAKTVNKENKDIHKALMKDPEYQKSLLEVMKNQEFENLLLDVMKSRPYRQQIMSVMQESLQSPLYQAQLIELFKKALEEQSKPKKQGQGQQEGGEGGQQGQGGSQGGSQ